MHVFYSANPSRLLVNCIAPLVADLQAQQLISRWFFIRYWMGGPHVRLRLLPAEGVSEQTVKAAAEAAIQAYLQRRPALFEMDPNLLKKHYRRMFEAEYGREAFLARYGEDGEVETYQSNTIHYIAYEAEYQRYAGPLGLDISERHFEVSSDIVLRITEETNVHARSIAMGRGIQLMLQMLYTFLEDDESVCAFLSRYIEMWQEIYDDRSNLYPFFDRKYALIAPRMRGRVAEIKRQLAAADVVSGLEIERQWITHARTLKAELGAAYATQQLELPDYVKSEREAFAYLLMSYIHMTNNRLSVSIGEEVYMAYVLRRAIEELRADATAEADVLEAQVA
jgi:hypothetical protein